jgi:hypothetical protein
MRAEVARTTARTDPVTRIFDLCHVEKCLGVLLPSKAAGLESVMMWAAEKGNDISGLVERDGGAATYALTDEERAA